MKRAIRVTSGFTLIVVGAALSIPGVPGPGLAIMLVGLLLLSDHFEWARRAVERIRSKTERLRQKCGPAAKTE